MSGRHGMEPSPDLRSSQVRHPGHAVARTVFQLIVGIAPMMPVIVSASGLPQTTAGVAAALAISAIVTRVMAIPVVDAALEIWLPWLAAEPDHWPDDTSASG